MRIARAPHRWSVTPERAREIQTALAVRVRSEAPKGRLRFVAGVDAAFTSGTPGRCVAAAVVWDIEARVVIEESVVTRPLEYPYVPGLLSFREAPAVLDALRRLRASVDAILCDGHGVAHPRRFGLACHVGLVCQRPTIGCAKSVLVGDHGALPASRGSRVSLVHDGEIVGSMLRTQTGVRPVVVSIGHKVDLKTAERIVLESAVRFRLPEPTRRADRLVARNK